MANGFGPVSGFSIPSLPILSTRGPSGSTSRDRPPRPVHASQEACFIVPDTPLKKVPRSPGPQALRALLSHMVVGFVWVPQLPRLRAWKLHSRLANTASRYAMSERLFFPFPFVLHAF